MTVIEELTLTMPADRVNDYLERESADVAAVDLRMGDLLPDRLSCRSYVVWSAEA